MNKTKKILIVFAIALAAFICLTSTVQAFEYILKADFNQYKNGNATTVEITATCNSNWNENTIQAVEIAVVPATAGNQTQLKWIRIGYGRSGSALNKKYTYNVYENCTIYVRYVYWWTIPEKYTSDIEFYRNSKYIDINQSTPTTLDQVKNVKPNIDGKKLTVTWDTVANAEGYEVNFTNKSKGINWNYDCKSPSIAFSAFSVADGHVVTVKAYRTVNGIRQYGATSTPVTFNIKDTVVTVGQVKNVKTTVNNKTLLVNWDSLNNIDGYEVNFKAENTNINWTYDWHSTGIYFPSFPVRNGYFVSVRAYKYVNGAKQYGEYSIPAYFNVTEATYVQKVTNVRAYVSGKTLTVYWNNVSDIDGYEVTFTAPGTNINWTYDWHSTGIYFPSFPVRNGYNVKIRAYKNINGVKQYGDYSDIVTFNIK